MNDSSLRTIHSYLSRYIDGELSPDERKLVEFHLHANQKLQTTVETLQDISAL
ncbi:MAG: anti-sigma factor family protein, partial [Candidatus Hinthialibacter sp.]